MPAYTRNIHSRQVWTVAYFGLPANAEANNSGHLPRCRFNVEKAVARLVAHSRKLTRGEPLLTDAPNGAEYRLHILMELWGYPRGDTPALADEPGLGGRATGNVYVPSGRELRPYLNLAKAVLILVARVREREELARVIRLKYGGHALSWEEFFFDFRDYESLRDYLVAHGQFQRCRGEARPVAVVVEIDRERQLRQTQIGHWQIYCVPIWCMGEGGSEIEIEPTLYTRDRGFAEKLAKEEHLLVCAIPTITGLKKPVRKSGLPVVDIRLTIVDRSQVCRIAPT